MNKRSGKGVSVWREMKRRGSKENKGEKKEGIKRNQSKRGLTKVTRK